MIDIRRTVEKHILELIDPYIDIDTHLSLDDLDPQVIAENAIVHYADSERIL